MLTFSFSLYPTRFKTLLNAIVKCERKETLRGPFYKKRISTMISLLESLYRFGGNRTVYMLHADVFVRIGTAFHRSRSLEAIDTVIYEVILVLYA